MFDPTVEPPIPISDVPKLPWMPASRTGKRIDLSVVFRWAARGLKDRAGAVVKLEAMKVGGRSFTSEAALRRFFARLADPAAVIPHPTPASRRRAVEAAKRELAESGI